MLFLPPNQQRQSTEGTQKFQLQNAPEIVWRAGLRLDPLGWCSPGPLAGFVGGGKERERERGRVGTGE